jgi:hypothetical protein
VVSLIARANALPGNSSIWIAIAALWVAVVAVSSLAVRDIGAAKLKQRPLTLAILFLSLVVLPTAAVLRLARPYTRQVLSLLDSSNSRPVTLRNGCSMFPADNIWNSTVQNLPLDLHSAAYIKTVGEDDPLHADFGPAGGYEYAVATGREAVAEVSFLDGAAESDPGPYRIPDNAPIESGSDAHVLVLNEEDCKLYELFGARRLGGQQWQASSGAIFDLRSNALRPSGWTSADAAGLPILPGLVRYDEVKSGTIRHALRFTTKQTRRAFTWPGRHQASRSDNPDLPPMGQRFRLRRSFSVAQLSPEAQVILNALKEYGMFLADNGGQWYLSGTLDSRWPRRVISDLRQVHGSDFEAVDSSTLILDPDSGQIRP